MNRNQYTEAHLLNKNGVKINCSHSVQCFTSQNCKSRDNKVSAEHYVVLITGYDHQVALQD